MIQLKINGDLLPFKYFFIRFKSDVPIPKDFKVKSRYKNRIHFIDENGNTFSIRVVNQDIEKAKQMLVKGKFIEFEFITKPQVNNQVNNI